MKSLRLAGESWTFSLAGKKDRASNLDAVVGWIESQGGTVLDREEGAVKGRIPREGGLLDWYEFRASGTSIQGWLLRERILKPGQPIEVAIGPGGFEDIYLTVVHDGKRFLNLVSEHETGAIRFEGDFRRSTGELEHRASFQHYADVRHGKRHVLSSLPQYAGRHAIRVSPGSRQKEGQKVRIALEAGPSIEQPEFGSALGGLRVENIPSGRVMIFPEYDDSFLHPEYSTSTFGDRTPKGDAVFWVPPGLWTVQSVPPDEAAFKAAKAHMIPVDSGRMTIVNWPSSLAQVSAPEGLGRIEILKASPVGEVDVSLLELADSGVLPTTANTTVYEGGLRGKVDSISLINLPLEVVLLIDSSGSMRQSMQDALGATRNFLKHLPDDARVSVVDFDSVLNVIEVDSRAGLLQALDAVEARGATALYDAIAMGLKQLKGADRPALVVFTDGVDSNLKGTGPGSKTTKAQVLDAVSKESVPIFTIGFGAKPDVDTLQRVASLSGGSYYQATDKHALERVFTAIQKNLGNQYRIKYTRPACRVAGDTPVMALVVDNSGSMDYDPKTEGCGYRIEKVRQILKRFVESLPSDYLIELVTFSDQTELSQVLSSERAPVFRGISTMKGNGGTDILGSMSTALQSLKSVPSSRRYLVYLTDAAMKVPEKSQQRFDTLLGEVSDSGVHSLFLGIVDKDEDGVFAHAAELAGGRTIVSPDLSAIEDAFQKLAAEVTRRPPLDQLSLRVMLKHRSEEGKNELYTATDFVDFAPKISESATAEPEEISIRRGERLTTYDDVVGRYISGTDLLIKDVRVSKRIPLDISASNTAVQISLGEAFFLTRLRGLDAPPKSRFLALSLLLTNCLEAQEVAIYPDGAQHPAAFVTGGATPLRVEHRVPPYLIPDLERHLYLRWNNRMSLPVSKATWLAEEPLVLPGEKAVLVPPSGDVKGAVVFVVPEENMLQSSLHFYDVNYGHIDIPISGVMEKPEKDVTALPTKRPTRLGDSFKLNIVGCEDVASVAQHTAGDGFLYRVLTAKLTSRVQALLNIAPAKRCTLVLPSSHGDLVFPLHEVTGQIPLGFYRPTMLAPGSRNVIKMAFRIPESFAQIKDKGSLVVDVRGGASKIPIGEDVAAKPSMGKPNFTGKGVDVYVQAMGRVKDGKIDGQKDVVAVEVSIHDKKDSYQTRLGPLLVLKKKDSAVSDMATYKAAVSNAKKEAATKKPLGLGNFSQRGDSDIEAAESVGVAIPIALSSKLIFVLDGRSVVADGTTRHGVICFRLPASESLEDWVLTSLMIDGTDMNIREEAFDNAVLLSASQELETGINSTFHVKLNEAVAKLKRQRDAKGYQRPGHVRADSVDLDSGDVGKQHLAPPAITLHGARQLGSLSAQDQLTSVLKPLRWVPGGRGWSSRYCAEAVLTQGWATSGDMARLAEKILNNRGIVSKRRSVSVSKRGQEKLAELAGGVRTPKDRELPAIEYQDADGSGRFIVFPFLEDLSAFDGLVAWDGSDQPPRFNIDRASVKVSAKVVRSRGTAASLTRDAAAALTGAGSGSEASIVLLDTRASIEEFSRGAVDIGFTEVTRNGERWLHCVFDGPNGREVGKRAVSLDDWVVVEEVLNIDLGDKRIERIIPLPKGHSLVGRFHTLGINLPDLPEEAMAALQVQRKDSHAKAHLPDSLSALRWYGRTVLARFIAAQSSYEAQLAKKLELVVGRSLSARGLMVTVEKQEDAGDVSVSVDLLRVGNDIHARPGASAVESERGFQILSGLAAARFEAAAVPEGKGIGFFDLLNQAPPGTQLIPVPRGAGKRQLLAELEARKVPARIQDHIKDFDGNLLFPSLPTMINGKPRWGWLEFDRDTYEVVARLDTGAGGALAEYLSLETIYDEGGQYLIGALIGVDASLWSVSAFSLQMSDYEKILKKAEAFAMGLSQNFGVKEDPDALAGAGVGGLPNLSYGPIKMEYDRSVKNNLLGFENGYKAGVAVYFRFARQ